MMPGYNDQTIKQRLLVWWIIWAGVLSGLIVIYLFLGRTKPLPPPSARSRMRGWWWNSVISP